MTYELILIRFGELSLKGKNKMDFVHQLANHVRQLCGLDKGQITIQIDRLFIPYRAEYLTRLGEVFGISSYSPVYRVPTNLEDFQNRITRVLRRHWTTFKVNARRHWKGFSLNSLELNRHLGTYIINRHGLKVDLHHPAVEINLEVHEHWSYLFFEKFRGLNGLPVGSSGSVVHLLSGGIDSPVAAYQMMKRGVRVNFLAFISPPHTDQTTVAKIELIVKQLNRYQLHSKLYLFNYTDLMNYIGLTSHQAYKIVLMRRSFYRIATQLAQLNHDLGIANGENLGQVASQTLEAMRVIHEATSLPIYQPLLTNDKIETIAQAQAIKTFEISVIKACETCELFAPEKPATKPNLETVRRLEAELDLLPVLEQQGLTTKVTLKEFKIEV